MLAGIYRFFEWAGNGITVDGVTVSEGFDESAAAADLEAACCRLVAFSELARFSADSREVKEMGAVAVAWWLLLTAAASLSTACDCLIFFSSTSLVSSLRSSSRSLRRPRSRSQISAAESSCEKMAIQTILWCEFAGRHTFIGINGGSSSSDAESA